MLSKRFAIIAGATSAATFAVALGLIRAGEGYLAAYKFENGGEAARETGLLLEHIGQSFFFPAKAAGDLGAPDWLLLALIPASCLLWGVVVAAVSTCLTRRWSGP